MYDENDFTTVPDNDAAPQEPAYTVPQEPVYSTPREPESSGYTAPADGACSYIPPRGERATYVCGAAGSQTAGQAQSSYSSYRSPASGAASLNAETSDKKKTRREKKERRGMSAGGVVALCLACALVAGAAGSAGTYALTKNSAVPAAAISETARTASAPLIPTVSYEGASNETAAAIYELATQQVVGITTTINYGYSVFGQMASAQIGGSGFIISEDGYIVTNYHVIEEAYESGADVTVMMYDETSYEAEIVGFDADVDIALLKIDAEGLTPAQLGDSDNLTVGQTVYAVGNPLGYLAYTMTSGIVSATNRTIATEVSNAVPVFQIDAAINNGNSGGPVYNTAGQIIGVVDAKSGASNVEGLAFAIPISEVAHIVNQIMEYGYVADKAYLGVTCSTVTEAAAKSYDMVVGAYINSVVEGSAAEAAGLQEGDIITALDGTAVTSSSGLTGMIKQHRAGDEAELTVWRESGEFTVTVVFGERPAEDEIPSDSGASQEPDNGNYGYYYGSGGDIDDLFRQFFGFGR